MNTRETKDRALHSSSSLEDLESPYLEEELFVEEAEAEWEAHLAALDGENLFRHAFEQDRAIFNEPEEPEEEFVEEEERQADTDDFPGDEAEAYDEAAPAELEDSIEELYDEGEDPYMEEETKGKSALPRMKFEFQTKNRIWRNDGKTPASLLDRKYGPKDFLVDRSDVRLESETHGVLEFETEWFRKWLALKTAIEKAVSMTVDMNGADPSTLEKTRKAFPFNVDHLRKASSKEEKILGSGEMLEVEIIDGTWAAGIQSSECFMLAQYESYLRQHEWPHYRDSAIDNSKAILDAANTEGVPETELANLRNFLLIIVNYVMRGQGGKVSDDAGAFCSVKGLAAKQAFTLMNRTSFSSMYRRLLTNTERALFRKIVKLDLILKPFGLNRKSPVFIEGYGSKAHHSGPTVFSWLMGIYNGVDLLSGRIGKGLSAAMGRYDVEIGKGKKDRWLVKFETRNTIMGATGIEAKDWKSYASRLYKFAAERRRRPVSWVLLPLGSKADSFLDLIHEGNLNGAITLANQQGIADENNLTSLVFHSIHLELGGRRILKAEKSLAKEWLQIRNDSVRPFLKSASSKETMDFGSELLDSEIELAERFVDDIGGGEFEEDESDVSLEEVEHPEYETEDDESDGGIEAHELDPVLVDLTEKTIAREAPEAKFLDEVHDLALNQIFEDDTFEDASTAVQGFGEKESVEASASGSETISTSPSTPDLEPLESAVAFERFSGPEHRDIGDLASGKEPTTIVYGPKGQRLSFGEVVALAGDYFATYDEMRDLVQKPGGKARIAWARWRALELKSLEPLVPDEVKDAVMEQYYLLASRNLSHFSAGGTAWQAYVLWHSKALVDALQAGEKSDKQSWRRALTKEAFGHHFLTDMFSAGHVRTPRAAIRDWYGRHFPGSDRLLRYMAEFMYDRLDERQQLPTLALWFESKAIKKIKGSIAKVGGEAVNTFSLGDIVSLALHDFDNRKLQVVSAVDPDGRPIQGGYRWEAVGDSHLGASASGALTKRMAVAAAIRSLRDLELVRGIGRKLVGRLSSTSQRLAAVKQALGDHSRVVFAAGRFVPKEDRTASTNVPLPGASSGASPLEWRWGQLGNVAYEEIDRTVKRTIAKQLHDLKLDVPERDKGVSGIRHAYLLFVKHLRAEGIRALEIAVGRKAR